MQIILLITAFLSLSFASEIISIKNAYVRLMPPNAKATAAFMTINNASDQDLKLIKVKTNVAEINEIHNVKMVKTKDSQRMIMKMFPVPFAIIPAKGELQLKKASLHIMMMKLQKPLKLGQKVGFEFIFDNNLVIKKSIEIKKQ